MRLKKLTDKWKRLFGILFPVSSESVGWIYNMVSIGRYIEKQSGVERKRGAKEEEEAGWQKKKKNKWNKSCKKLGNIGSGVVVHTRAYLNGKK